MQIIKLLIISLFVFFLNVNLFADQVNVFALDYVNNTAIFSEKSVEKSTSSTKKDTNPLLPVHGVGLEVITDDAEKSVEKTTPSTKKDTNLSLLIYGIDLEAIADSADNNKDAVVNKGTVLPYNPKVHQFMIRLLSTASLYVKWLQALEYSIKYDDNFVFVDNFLSNNECSSCTYQEVIQALKVKKANHLVFWTGSYQTNLISNKGTGKPIDLVINRYAKVRDNEVITDSFQIDGKVVLNAKFKNYRLTWDYGTNMQINDHKGDITFADVILNGEYVGHQFAGTLTRHLDGIEGAKESFAGFAYIPLSFGGYNDNSNSDGNGSNSGGNNSNSGGNGSNPDGNNSNSDGNESNSGGIGLNPDNGAGTGTSDNDINPITGRPQMSIGFIDYPAKKFGTQIWTTENMRSYPSKVGHGFWTDIDNNGNRAMLYDWNAAMNGETTEGAQGICAPGWRIPTDGDWKTLEAFLGMKTDMQNKNNAYRGSDQGAQLLVNGSSGFNAQLLGYRGYGATKNKASGTSFVTSTSVSGSENTTFTNRHIGSYTPTYQSMRFILLKQGSSSTQSWRFFKVRAMKDGISFPYDGYDIDSADLDTNGELFLSGSSGKNFYMGSSGWLRIDLRGYVNIDSIEIIGEPSLDPAFKGEGMVVFVSRDYINPSHAADKLRYDTNGIQFIGIPDGTATDQTFKIPVYRFKNTQDPKTIWRGGELKSIGTSVRCVKDSGDPSISVYSPKKIILKVGEPMTPLGFGSTITSKTRNWSISPALDNGLQFTTTGILSGTPLTVKEATDYLVTTADDSKAVSTINITITNDIIVVSSIQITGDNLIKVGDNTQLSATISPSYATNKGIVWSIIEGHDKAIIDQKGKLTALKSGNIKVAATTIDHSATYGTFDVVIASEEKITLNGKHYLAITSDTGRVWLDRNLGASKACTSVTDSACYGNLYQWGRRSDGHQLRNPDPELSTIPATSIKNTNENFIVNTDDWTAFGVDDSGNNRQLAWRSGYTNSICPTGFSLPTIDEFKAEMNNSSLSTTIMTTKGNQYNAQNLELPLNGLRNKAGQEQFSGSRGYYWTQDTVDLVANSGDSIGSSVMLTAPSVTSPNDKLPDRVSANFIVNSDNSYQHSSHVRTAGMGVRCIKDQQPFISPNVNDLKATVGVAITPITWVNVGRMVTGWEITPALPDGLSFDTKTGTISGVPNEKMSARDYRITASNSVGTDVSWVRITVINAQIVVTNIQLESANTSLIVGKTVRFNAVISPSNADNSISWSLSDTNLATIDDTGLITGLKSGVVTVFAHASDNSNVFDSISFDIVDYYHDGKTYNAVESSKTGRIWLDRDLGASQVCSSRTDIECYGDLYQFGRANDGHQKRSTYHFTEIQASNIAPSNALFVLTGRDWASIDPGGDLRARAWGYGGSNSICPAGFVMPTVEELINEGIDLEPTTFANFLKLPAAGRRNANNGTLSHIGVTGYYWTGMTTSNFQGKSLDVTDKGITLGNSYRNQGRSVRCIQYLNYKDKRYNRAPMEISGIKYKTIILGNQIWTAENMRHGTNSQENGIYSYENNSSNDILYGKYYTLSAALNGKTKGYGQGICASGWHIPMEDDWRILEDNLGIGTLSQDRQQAWRGTYQGKQLQKWGSSGFDAVMSGRIETDVLGSHSILKNQETSFWTPEYSTLKNKETSLFRTLNSSLTQIYKGSVDSSKNAFSVRCIKDSLAPMVVAASDAGFSYGFSYEAIKLGQQVWTARNMSHDTTFGKTYSYDDNQAYDGSLGKLYNWEAAMSGSQIEGSQGICGVGWHIPTDYDWRVLEEHLGMQEIDQDRQWAWRGNSQGQALKKGGYSGFGASIFNNNATSLWTSSRRVSGVDSSTLFRSLKESSPRIYRGSANMDTYALNVRCIKNAN